MGHVTSLSGHVTSFSFSVRKAAQVAAYFAKQQGGSINVLKLAKLIYLADRRFMSEYDEPMLYDNLVSMDHGPVDSMTLDCVNGYSSKQDIWAQYILGRAGYSVGLSNPDLEIESLDELSNAEIQVLAETWSEFGQMDQYQLRDYVHVACLEWEDPHGSSNPIPYERVFKFLGKDKASELAEQIEEHRRLNAALAPLLMA